MPAHRPSRVEVGLPPTALVLASFNNSYKVNPQIFDIWCRLLRKVDSSVLWILADSSSAQENLRREARHRGADPERLMFVRRVSYEDYLARMELADLFLDTFPFNGGTTASDALWQGLPVLTCSGEALASRMAGSLLTASDLPELITFSLDEYERRALQLAADPTELARLRARLLTQRATHPVFDPARFCRHLEEAYRTMWLRHERGELPAAFAVPPRELPG
jgi:protein O-GlcNAc transferase